MRNNHVNTLIIYQCSRRGIHFLYSLFFSVLITRPTGMIENKRKKRNMLAYYVGKYRFMTASYNLEDLSD